MKKFDHSKLDVKSTWADPQPVIPPASLRGAASKFATTSSATGSSVNPTATRLRLHLGLQRRQQLKAPVPNPGFTLLFHIILKTQEQQ